MTRLFFLAALATVFCFQMSAQTPNKEQIKEVLINKDMKITWLGADFSHAKIQDYLGCDAARFVTEIIPAINNVVLMEPAKYDFAKLLDKKSVSTDIQAVTKSNAGIHSDDMTQNAQEKLNETTINSIVGSYDLKGKEGVGVVLIYESLSKLNLYSSMYLTYVKMPEGTVILSKHVTAKPMGFGLRNFWASTIYFFLKDYKKFYSKSWKAEYGIK